MESGKRIQINRKPSKPTAQQQIFISPLKGTIPKNHQRCVKAWLMWDKKKQAKS